MQKVVAERVDRKIHNVDQNVWKVKLVRGFATSMAFPLPIIVLFWQSSGLSMTEVMVLQALFAAALALFEVPSGYLADMLGRKQTIVAAGVFLTVGTGIYGVVETFNGFLFAEILLAVGFALISGADQALLFDSLVESGREREFSRHWGGASSIEMGFAAVGCVAGGLLGSVSFRLPFYVATVGYGCLMLVALTLREPERTKRQVKEGHVKELLSIARYSFFEKRTLGWLMVFSAIIVAFLQTGLWLYQPYFKLCEIPVVYFGWLFAGMNVVAALCCRYAHLIERPLGPVRSCVLAIVVLSVSYLLLGSVVQQWGFLIIVLHQFVRGFTRVVFSDYVNAETSSDVRATTISLKSMSERLLYVAALLPAGWLADNVGVLSTHHVMGCAVLVVGAAALLLRPKHS